MAKQYQWRDGFPRSGTDPQEVGERLDHLHNRHGELLPKDVVRDAQKPSSPMHNLFEWDDTVAAEEHRLEQARTLIRSIRIIKVGDDQPRRVYVNVRTNDHSSYVTMKQVRRDPELIDQVLNSAIRDLSGWLARYEELQEVCGGRATGQVTRARDQLSRELEKRENSVAA